MKSRNVKLWTLGVMVCAAVVTVVVMRSVADDELSPDCQHVDTALRAYVRALPDVQQAMFPGSQHDPQAVAASAAASATEVRGQIDGVESSAMHTDLRALADGLDLIGASRTVADAPGPDFFRGYQATMTAAHELVLACPGVGDPSPEEMPVRPSS